jgi:hypothetical protein
MPAASAITGASTAASAGRFSTTPQSKTIPDSRPPIAACAIPWEVLLTLHFMGGPVTLEKAVILESLDTTISVAAFFVPGSWGAQEGGYILIGQMLGLPAHLSLSLSFVKRIPDFLLAFSFGRYLKRAMYPPGRASAMKTGERLTPYAELSWATVQKTPRKSGIRAIDSDQSRGNAERYFSPSSQCGLRRWNGNGSQNVPTTSPAPTLRITKVA